MLQDIAPGIADIADPRCWTAVEAMVHDVFPVWSVRGGRVCCLRAVLHELPRRKCGQMLQHVRDAMAKNSVWVVDDKLMLEESLRF